MVLEKIQKDENPLMFLFFRPSYTLLHRSVTKRLYYTLQNRSVMGKIWVERTYLRKVLLIFNKS